MAAARGAALAEWREALLGLPRNPLLLREMRGWRRRTLDWRLWFGFRLPRQVREWGLPAIIWFSLAPYVIWAAVSALHRYAPSLPAADNALIFEVVIFGLVLYACVVIAVGTATAIVAERQGATWESLLVTPLSGAELVLGCLAARAGPVLAGVLAAILVWAAAQPHYAMLLEPVGGLTIPPGDFLVFGGAMLVRMLTLAALGVAVSARARHGGSAAAASIALALALLATDFAAMGWLEATGAAPLRAPIFLAGSTLLGAAALELARRRVRRVG